MSTDDLKPPRDLTVLPFAEQDTLAKRYAQRVTVKEAIKELVRVLKEWCQDEVPDYRRFNAVGHAGMYQEFPGQTLARKLWELGFDPATIDRITGSPMDFMTTEELLDVYARIQAMLKYFAATKQGTFEHACSIYSSIGQLARANVLAKTGHTPEDYIAEYVRINGQEAAKRFMPRDVY